MVSSTKRARDIELAGAAEEEDDDEDSEDAFLLAPPAATTTAAAAAATAASTAATAAAALPRTSRTRMLDRFSSSTWSSPLLLRFGESGEELGVEQEREQERQRERRKTKEEEEEAVCSDDFWQPSRRHQQQQWWRRSASGRPTALAALAGVLFVCLLGAGLRPVRLSTSSAKQESSTSNLIELLARGSRHHEARQKSELEESLRESKDGAGKHAKGQADTEILHSGSADEEIKSKHDIPLDTVDWRSVNLADYVPRGTTFINVTDISLHANNLVSSWQLQKLVNNGTKWWQRLSPVRIWKVVSNEASEVTECMYKSEKNKSVSFLTAVGRMQPCISDMIDDHEQKGLIIPLKNFDYPVPTRWSYIFSSLVVTVTTIMMGLMLKAILGGDENKVNWKPQFALIPTIAVPSLQGEVTLAALQPFIVAGLAIGLGLLLGGKPSGLLTLPLLLGPILRSTITDAIMFYNFVKSNKTWWDRLLRREGPSAAKAVSFCGLWNCVMSKLLVLDASTDGIAVATVFLAEHYDSEGLFHARNLAMWGHGTDGWFLPLMGYSHSLSAAMLAVLVVSSTFGVAICTDPKRPLSTLLNAAGLGLTSDSVTAVEDEKRGSVQPYDWLTDFQMTVLEAVPQFYLQVLLVMALDQELVEVPTLAISIVSSYICGSLSLFSCLQVILGNLAASGEDRRQASNYAFLLATVLALLALSLTAVRLFVAETCETHLWRLLTGCVVAPVAGE